MSLACPWYLVGANFFDLQHFRGAHDRRVVGEPVVDTPAPFARRASARFRIEGDSLQDRLTRRFAGDMVEMSIVDWCGNMMFTTARFSRTCSYGMAVTEPIANGGVDVKLIVFVPQSHGPLGRMVADPVNRWVRRIFIMNFLSSDSWRLNGLCYSPHGLIDDDRHLAEYLHWLAIVSHGTPQPRAGDLSDATTTASTSVQECHT
jgi:hypothetical protein